MTERRSSTPPGTRADGRPGEAASDQPLTLREWQVWHTYASFFDTPLPALESVARRLVENGAAECAVTSDGAAWWATDDVRPGEEVGAPARSDRRPVAAGLVEVRPGPDRGRFEVRPPPGLLAHPYATDSLMNWAWSRHAELQLFGDGPLPARYVWAQLGACTLTAVAPEARRLVLYPQLKIFETGVVLVHLRMLSPERPVRVDEFVSRYLNAPLDGYRWAHVPPGIAAWAPMVAPEPGIRRWYRRPWTAYRQWYHQRAVAKHAEVEEGGDFAFWQVSLSLAQDAALTKKAVEEANPDMARRARELLRAEAAARGVHLSEDLKTVSLDPGVRVVSDGEALTPDEHGPRIAGGGGDGEATSSPVRVVDLDDIQQATLLRVEAEARHVGRAVGERTVYAPGRAPETFSGLALMVMGVAGLVAGTDRRGPRQGLALALLGPGRVREAGSHWTGRPHAHLLRFAGQSSSAAENARRFGSDLGAVMLRAVARDRALAARHLPDSTRAFDDHGAYLAPQCTLWVYTSEVSGPRSDGARPGSKPASASAPGDRQRRDAGSEMRGTLRGSSDAHAEASVSLRPGAERAMQVFAHQTKVELLEYAYMLHRRIADRATGGATAADRVVPALLEAQRDLADFEWALQDTGRYGEVRDQLEAGLTAYGVPKLRERVAGLLRVRQEAALYHGGAAAARWAAFLAVVAGVLAAPPLADAIVTPTWRFFRLPRPASDDGFALVCSAVALALVAVVLAVGYTAARRGISTSRR